MIEMFVMFVAIILFGLAIFAAFLVAWIVVFWGLVFVASAIITLFRNRGPSSG